MMCKLINIIINDFIFKLITFNDFFSAFVQLYNVRWISADIYISSVTHFFVLSSVLGTDRV